MRVIGYYLISANVALSCKSRGGYKFGHKFLGMILRSYRTRMLSGFFLWGRIPLVRLSDAPTAFGNESDSGAHGMISARTEN
jgi:hypothetical protein